MCVRLGLEDGVFAEGHSGRLSTRVFRPRKTAGGPEGKEQQMLDRFKEGSQEGATMRDTFRKRIGDLDQMRDEPAIPVASDLH